MVRTGIYHDLFAYSAIVDRPPLRWPNGAHVAVWVVPNIEHYELVTPTGGIDVRTISGTDYGNRVGIWRVMEVLDRYRIRGTVALNSSVCQLYPRVIEEALGRKWELMGHGLTNSQMLSDLTAEEERVAISQTVGDIRKATGQPVRGWLGPGLIESPHTLELLREAGVEYVCDWVNDDQPYRMHNGLYSIPYTIELNDRPVVGTKNHTAPEFAQIICDAFDVLYREGESQGRVMCIALHPYIIGAPNRISYLDKALAHIAGHEKVWLTTGSEIIDWYRKTVTA